MGEAPARRTGTGICRVSAWDHRDWASGVRVVTTV